MTHTKLRNELEKTRKLLLAYRMLHWNDTIKDVRLNICNREAELTKPLIRLFQNSPDVLNELLPALSTLLNAKRKVKSNSIEAKLYTAIRNLIPYHDYTIDNQSIINEIMQITEGQDIGDQQAFYSTDTGTVTDRKIFGILVDKFKADRTHKGSGNDKKRALQFQEEDLARKGREYDVPDEIEILPTDHANSNPTEEELDSFDSIFLSSSSVVAPDFNPDIKIEDDNQKDNNGTEGTQSGGVTENNDTLTSIISIDQLRKYNDDIRNILKYIIQNNQSVSSNNSQNMSATF